MDSGRAIFPLLAGAAAASLTVTAAQAQTHRLHRDGVLGTSLDMTAVGGGEAAAQAAFAAALAEIERLDGVLSGWRADSELARLNAGRGLAASPDLYAVVAAAESWRTYTDGAFDGRLGRVEALWRTAGEQDRLPDPSALANAAASARAEPIRFDPVERAIGRPEGAVLALDGLAKGYVIDAALAAARRAAPSLTGLMIDIGGDLAVHGTGPSGDAWAIGAADPFRPEDNAAPGSAIRLTGGAVATSGRGLRDLSIGGRGYGLRLEPETGRPAQAVLAATAFAPCAMDADALATALSVMAPHEGLALAERTAGAEAMIVDADGRRHATSGWSRLAMEPAPRLIRVAAPGAAPAVTAWPSGFVATIDYEMPRPDIARVYSPYVTIWVTDASNRLVRQLVLLGNNDNYIDQNFIWWRRFGRGEPQVVEAVSRPTRPAGRYVAVWDGKDQAGQPVGQGRFTIHLEATREHGLHTYQAITLDLGAAPVEGEGMKGDELGATLVRYGKRR